MMYTRKGWSVMADEKQLEIISEDGVHRWNAWRAENPEVLTDIAGTNLEGVYLQGANFKNTNLQGANLTGANLQGANFTGANLQTCTLVRVNLQGANLQGADLEGASLTDTDLRRANVQGANLTGADLTRANFTEAKLTGTNFRGATLTNAVFEGAELSQETLGLGRLPHAQRAKMKLVDVTPIPEDTPQEADTQISDNVKNISVGYARRIVNPARLALQGLSIPNDCSEEHRDLFAKLISTVTELEKKLADIQEEYQLLSDECEELRNSVNQKLPLWKRAWEEFVLKSAGGIGASAGTGAVFAAGFIAGMLYINFSPAELGINV